MPKLGSRFKNTQFSTTPGFAGFVQLFQIYQSNARKRNRVFEITKEQFAILTKMNCHYCDSEPSTIKTTGVHAETKAHNTYVYNGLDRKDNSTGYTLENVVPCCKTCNNAKRALTQDEWETWLDKIVAKRNKNLAIARPLVI